LRVLGLQIGPESALHNVQPPHAGRAQAFASAHDGAQTRRIIDVAAFAACGLVECMQVLAVALERPCQTVTVGKVRMTDSPSPLSRLNPRIADHCMALLLGSASLTARVRST
jgi:hypothetical protein